MRKYRFVGEKKIIYKGKEMTLHRIQALRNFGNVQEGEIGGWIEKESNLSHDGEAWVYDSAQVYDNAIVKDNARVYNFAKVHGCASVRNAAVVLGRANVFERAYVCEDAIVRSCASVYGRAIVNETARVDGESCVCEDATISGKVVVYGRAIVKGHSYISGFARVHESAKIHGNAFVGGTADISGTSAISGNTRIEMGKFALDAELFSVNDFLVVGTLGSRNDYTTFYRRKSGGIAVNCGCFNDSLDNFIETVGKVHSNNQYGKEYLLAAELARMKLEKNECQKTLIK